MSELRDSLLPTIVLKKAHDDADYDDDVQCAVVAAYILKKKN